MPGSEGGGIADVLFKAGDGSVAHDFSGRLSFSWPRNPQQTAVNRGQSGERPLFAYGYGLTYASDGNLKALPEDPGTPAVAQVDTRTFFVSGRPGSGWQWFAGAGSDLRQSRELPGGVGMGGEGRLRLQATDHAAQEDARLLTWSGGGASTIGLSGKSPIDLQREANGQLSLGFDYRVGKSSKADIAVLMECGAGCRGSVPITQAVGGSPAGQWMHLKIPLACFAHAGADMSRISAPFSVTTSGELELSVGNIRLETGTDKVLDCAH